jgi:hypothetical protein
VTLAAMAGGRRRPGRVESLCCAELSEGSADGGRQRRLIDCVRVHGGATSPAVPLRPRNLDRSLPTQCEVLRPRAGAPGPISRPYSFRFLLPQSRRGRAAAGSGRDRRSSHAGMSSTPGRRPRRSERRTCFATCSSPGISSAEAQGPLSVACSVSRASRRLSASGGGAAKAQEPRRGLEVPCARADGTKEVPLGRRDECALLIACENTARRPCSAPIMGRSRGGAVDVYSAYRASRSRCLQALSCPSTRLPGRMDLVVEIVLKYGDEDRVPLEIRPSTKVMEVRKPIADEFESMVQWVLGAGRWFSVGPVL